MTTFQLRQILVGTDFSDLSTRALRHAAMWARQYGAHLTVLHAQEFPPIATDPYFGSFSLATLMEATREATEREIDEYVRQHVPEGVAVSWEVTPGSPAAAIEEAASALCADLVVLGTHGRGGLTRLLLGSVAERALRMAEHPTLVVRQLSAENNPTASEPRLRHVLCPVNYTDVAKSAFEHAATVAEAFQARLTAVFIVEPREPDAAAGGSTTGGPPVAHRWSPSAEEAREKLKAWLPAEAINGCEIQVRVRHGDAAEQVIALAREKDVDLVVVGAQHRRFVDSTVLGVTTVRVTRHAPCPVLIVPRSE